MRIRIVIDRETPAYNGEFLNADLDGICGTDADAHELLTRALNLMKPPKTEERI